MIMRSIARRSLCQFRTKHTFPSLSLNILELPGLRMERRECTRRKEGACRASLQRAKQLRIRAYVCSWRAFWDLCPHYTETYGKEAQHKTPARLAFGETVLLSFACPLSGVPWFQTFSYETQCFWPELSCPCRPSSQHQSVHNVAVCSRRLSGFYQEVFKRLQGILGPRPCFVWTGSAGLPSELGF